MQNKNARIKEVIIDGGIDVSTSNRDAGTLTAEAIVRERTDVLSGRSLTQLNIRLANGRKIRLSGHEARTLYRVLAVAANG